MGRIEETVRLAAAPQTVWDVVSDPARFGEWLTMHRSWESDLPAQIREGDRVTAVVSLLNMPTTITWTVEAYVAPEHVRLAGTGLAGVQVSIDLDVAPDGADASSMTIVAQFEGQLLAGAIGQAVEKAGRDELKSSAEKLRALVV